MADDGGATGFGAGARTIRSPDDAEQVAAEWMRRLGFDDARCTGAGTDGGVDVRSSEALAQVKAQLTPVGRPELQALFGVASSEGRRPLFFSLMSYTAAARAWADEVGMALFRFDHAGAVEPVNPPAEALLVAAGEPRMVRPPAWPVRLSDRAGRAAIARERRGLLFAEQVAFAGLGWMWVQLVRLDYTAPTRRAVAHRSTTLAFDLLSGAPFPLPGVEPATLEAPGAPGRREPVGEKGPLPATMETAAVLRLINDSWEKLEAVTRPAVVERHRAALAYLGVPPEALTVSPSAGERVLAPVFVGLLEHRRARGLGGVPQVDSRVVVCSGVTGASLSDLASYLTSRLPGALEEIVGRVRHL